MTQDSNPEAGPSNHLIVSLFLCCFLQRPKNQKINKFYTSKEKLSNIVLAECKLSTYFTLPIHQTRQNIFFCFLETSIPSFGTLWHYLVFTQEWHQKNTQTFVLAVFQISKTAVKLQT